MELVFRFWRIKTVLYSEFLVHWFSFHFRHINIALNHSAWFRSFAAYFFKSCKFAVLEQIRAKLVCQVLCWFQNQGPSFFYLSADYESADGMLLRFWTCHWTHPPFSQFFCFALFPGCWLIVHFCFFPIGPSFWKLEPACFLFCSSPFSSKKP